MSPLIFKVFLHSIVSQCLRAGAILFEGLLFRFNQLGQHLFLELDKLQNENMFLGINALQHCEPVSVSETCFYMFLTESQ